ncbi:MAG: hypothetical protein V4714_17800 [Bacteroidota bacterium]
MSEPQAPYGFLLLIESEEQRIERERKQADDFYADAVAYCNGMDLSPKKVLPRYFGVEKVKAYLIEEAKRARVEWNNSKALRALPIQRKWKAKERYILVLGMISTFKAACK